MPELHPTLNAFLNLTTTCLLVAAFVAVKRRQIARHRALMLAAIVTSAIFLASYVARFLLTGAHRFPEVGMVKTVYLVILGTHSLLALVALPMILRTAYLGLKRQDPRHRALARYTWPVWMYVSITGVVVYLMLYHLAPRLA